jgi:hypothetical protein
MQMTSFRLIVRVWNCNAMVRLLYTVLDSSRMSYSSSTMGVAGYETDIMKPETCQVFDIDKTLCNNTLYLDVAPCRGAGWVQGLAISASLLNFTYMYYSAHN